MTHSVVSNPILLCSTAANKSRHSMFSDTSDLDPHHPSRANFTMPRENLSGDSRVWLLNHHPISAGLGGINSALSESDGVTPDRADAECKCLSMLASNLKP